MSRRYQPKRRDIFITSSKQKSTTFMPLIRAENSSNGKAQYSDTSSIYGDQSFSAERQKKQRPQSAKIDWVKKANISQRSKNNGQNNQSNNSRNNSYFNILNNSGNNSNSNNINYNNQRQGGFVSQSYQKPPLFINQKQNILTARPQSGKVNNFKITNKNSQNQNMYKSQQQQYKKSHTNSQQQQQGNFFDDNQSLNLSQVSKDTNFQNHFYNNKQPQFFQNSNQNLQTNSNFNDQYQQQQHQNMQSQQQFQNGKENQLKVVYLPCISCKKTPDQQTGLCPDEHQVKNNQENQDENKENKNKQNNDKKYVQQMEKYGFRKPPKVEDSIHRKLCKDCHTDITYKAILKLQDPTQRLYNQFDNMCDSCITKSGIDIDCKICKKQVKNPKIENVQEIKCEDCLYKIQNFVCQNCNKSLDNPSLKNMSTKICDCCEYDLQPKSPCNTCNNFILEKEKRKNKGHCNQCKRKPQQCKKCDVQIERPTIRNIEQKQCDHCINQGRVVQCQKCEKSIQQGGQNDNTNKNYREELCQVCSHTSNLKKSLSCGYCGIITLNPKQHNFQSKLCDNCVDQRQKPQREIQDCTNCNKRLIGKNKWQIQDEQGLCFDCSSSILVCKECKVYIQNPTTKNTKEQMCNLCTSTALPCLKCHKKLRECTQKNLDNKLCDTCLNDGKEIVCQSCATNIQNPNPQEVLQNICEKCNQSAQQFLSCQYCKIKVLYPSKDNINSNLCDGCISNKNEQCIQCNICDRTVFKPSKFNEEKKICNQCAKNKQQPLAISEDEKKKQQGNNVNEVDQNKKQKDQIKKNKLQKQQNQQDEKECLDCQKQIEEEKLKEIKDNNKERICDKCNEIREVYRDSVLVCYSCNQNIENIKKKNADNQICDTCIDDMQFTKQEIQNPDQNYDQQVGKYRITCNGCNQLIPYPTKMNVDQKLCNSCSERISITCQGCETQVFYPLEKNQQQKLCDNCIPLYQERDNCNNCKKKIMNVIEFQHLKQSLCDECLYPEKIKCRNCQISLQNPEYPNKEEGLCDSCLTYFKDNFLYCRFCLSKVNQPSNLSKQFESCNECQLQQFIDFQDKKNPNKNPNYMMDTIQEEDGFKEQIDYQQKKNPVDKIIERLNLLQEENNRLKNANKNMVRQRQSVKADFKHQLDMKDKQILNFQRQNDQLLEGQQEMQNLKDKEPILKNQIQELREEKQEQNQKIKDLELMIEKLQKDNDTKNEENIQLLQKQDQQNKEIEQEIEKNRELQSKIVKLKDDFQEKENKFKNDIDELENQIVEKDLKLEKEKEEHQQYIESIENQNKLFSQRDNQFNQQNMDNQEKITKLEEKIEDMEKKEYIDRQSIVELEQQNQILQQNLKELENQTNQYTESEQQFTQENQNKNTLENIDEDNENDQEQELKNNNVTTKTNNIISEEGNNEQLEILLNDCDFQDRRDNKDIDILVQELKKIRQNQNAEIYNLLKKQIPNSSKLFTEKQVQQIQQSLGNSFVDEKCIKLISNYVTYMEPKEVVDWLNVTQKNEKLQVLKVISKNMPSNCESIAKKIVNNAFKDSSEPEKQKAIEIITKQKARNPTFGTVDGKNIIFMIDISKSMETNFKTKKGNEINRLEYAKKSIIQVIEQQLVSSQKFNVFAFHLQCDKWKNTSQLATPKNKQDAIKFINKLNFKDWTDLGNAITQAFNQEDIPDKIEILSDGFPNKGIQKESELNILYQRENVKSMKQGNPNCQINSCMFLLGQHSTETAESRKIAKSLMEKLSQSSLGVFRSIDNVNI